MRSPRASPARRRRVRPGRCAEKFRRPRGAPVDFRVVVRLPEERSRIAMRYILLIYSKETDWTSLPDEEKGEMYQQYVAFTESLRKSGHYVAGDGLEPTTTATTVRVRNGKTLTTAGPFAETRGQPR